MFLVRLNRKMSFEKEERILRSKPGVKAVLPESARRADLTSLRSLEDHHKYLAALPKKADDGDGDDFDYNDSQLYYMRDHVALGSDKIDMNALRKALVHKAQMPQAHIGETSGTPPPGLTPQGYGSWDFIGPRNLATSMVSAYGYGPLIGRISAIAYDPTTAETIYCSSGGGGVWKSTNGGLNWDCMTDKSPWITGSVGAIAIDPTSHNTVYVGTGDFVSTRDNLTQGIMKSTDGGTTWTNLTPSVLGISDCAISQIIVDPDNTSILLCSTGNSPTGGIGGVFRSTNGGVTWTNTGLPATDWSAMDYSIKNGSGVRTFWAAGTSSVEALLYYSSNDGATWTKATPPNGDPEGDWTIACSKVSATKLYALSPYDQTVFESTNSGATWTDIGENLPNPPNESNWKQKTYDYVLGTYAAPAAPMGEILFVGLIGFDYTMDDGAAWVDYGKVYESGDVLHADQHRFALSPTDPTQALEGNDGGLFRLSFSWTGSTPTITSASLNANLGITQFYHVAPHPTDVTQILGGAQDNASPSSLGNLNSWANPGGSDGGCCGWMTQLGEFFLTYQNGNIYVVNDTTLGRTHLGGDFSDVAFIAPTILSGDANTLYIGAEELWACDLTASTLALKHISPVITTSYINAIGISPSDASQIYTGGADGEIYVSQNATASTPTWTEIDNAPLPYGAVIDAISVNASNPSDVLVGYGNTGNGHLYQCLNPTAATPTWTEVGGTGNSSLPDQPLRTIVRDPYSPATTWYVGTSVGVFMTKNSGATWANVSANLPNTEVYDMEVGPGYLYAGTFGRGVWRVQFPAPVTVASLVPKVTTLQGGSSTTAMVTLSGAPGVEGAIVNLSSSSALVTVPATVYFSPATTAQTVAVTTSGAFGAQMTITLKAQIGAQFKTATLTLTPPPAQLSSIALGATDVAAFTTVPCTVNILGSPASGTTYVVKLSSSSKSAVVPATANFTSGISSQSLNITTSQVAATTAVKITATAGSITTSATMVLFPSSPIVMVGFNSTSATGGTTLTCTLTLSGNAPSSGEEVTLLSNSASATVPPSVTVPKNAKSVSFSITTNPVTTATTVIISGTAGGATAQGTFKLNP
jgi:hypothetical protein